MTEFWHSRFETSIKHQKITVDVSECVLSDTDTWPARRCELFMKKK